MRHEEGIRGYATQFTRFPGQAARPPDVMVWDRKDERRAALWLLQRKAGPYVYTASVLR